MLAVHGRHRLIVVCSPRAMWTCHVRHRLSDVHRLPDAGTHADAANRRGSFAARGSYARRRRPCVSCKAIRQPPTLGRAMCASRGRCGQSMSDVGGPLCTSQWR
ncbi:hypothetical protein H5410_004709 [Solanum commersonii]|uniref:Uncharacterized protein n=1 Tax=Solanum commersonii TaxID=4109 RepID=A0A9J6A5C0_SOLCO|nr:hypothetical protein H5410_004709 [Solanum commersonii]